MLHKHNIFNGIWMMEQGFASNYMPQITAFLKGQKLDIPKQEVNPLKIHTQSDSLLSASSSAGEHSDNTGYIAVLSISGVITKHDQFCGPAGMVTISSLLEECYANDEINGIVLEVESGGGEFMGMRLVNETIAKRNKPIVAFINDNACSAAYGIVSGCDYIVANSTMTNIGSIGTYISIADFSQQLKNEGIDIITVYATDSKNKNEEVREALKGNLKPLQQLTDTYNESFLTTIETNRAEQLKFGRKVWGTGKVFFAEDALEIGLIDEINTFNNILNYFV